jgi:hypothetical protein
METIPMRKVALLVAACGLATSTAMAVDTGPEMSVASAAAASCHPGQTLDLGCAMRAADTDGNGTISPAELASLAIPPQPATDWTPLRPTGGTGLDFKDAATNAGGILPAIAESDASLPLIPALFALGALLILLRQRPR